MKKILYSLCVAAMLFTSCKKEDSADTELELTLNNVAGSYKLTAATISINNIPQDMLSGTTYFDTCEKDDIATFTTTGGYSLNDAGVVCNPSGSFSGSYSVNNSAKTITIDGDTFTVKSFTRTKIVAEASDSFGGITTVVNFTYTRQ